MSFCPPPTRAGFYDYKIKTGEWGLPDASDIPNGYRDPEHPEAEAYVMETTLKRYEQIRRESFLKSGWDNVDKDGKIKDQALIAIIISTEVRNLSAYPLAESMEAISRQYYSEKTSETINCHGSCNITQQLSWMTNMHGFRTGKLADWESQMDRALEVMDPTFKAGTARDSWFWGNVSGAELSNFDIVYQEKQDEDAYFIIHR